MKSELSHQGIKGQKKGVRRALTNLSATKIGSGSDYASQKLDDDGDTPMSDAKKSANSKTQTFIEAHSNLSS